jgi:myo-inositol-1(or 4)-monophosphatase
VKRHQQDVARIVDALEAGAKIYRSRSMESVRVDRKHGGDPVTDAEQEVNQLLFEMLVRPGEGWLSEESADNAERLQRSRIWLVDPLDGTKEYVTGIPEWCISVALLEQGHLVAAGILNPRTEELVYGSAEDGITAMCAGNGFHCETLDLEPLVLGSRSEVKRGEWERFRESKFRIQPMGSVAYKLALVAAGKAHATWTLVPKHEWDVAAGVALLGFSAGIVLQLTGEPPVFNQPNPIFRGLIAFSAVGVAKLHPFLAELMQRTEFKDCQPWAKRLIDSAATLGPSKPSPSPARE